MTRSRGLVAIAMLCAVAACENNRPEPPPPEPPVVQHLLSVRQHAALPTQLDAVRVDGILVEMTGLVQGADGSTDVACEVGFARFGQLGTFTSDEIPFSINNEADFRRVDGIGGSVKVVGEINWCGRLGVGIIGCASTPGPRLAVVRFTPNQEAVLWTHEFGHTTGSPHRDGAGALMQPFIGADHRGVDQGECTRLIAGSEVVQVRQHDARCPCLHRQRSRRAGERSRIVGHDSGVCRRAGARPILRAQGLLRGRAL